MPSQSTRVFLAETRIQDMTNKKFQLPLALSGLTVGFGSKSRSVLAHSGHSHSASPDSQSTNLEKVSQPSDETSNDVTETLESQPNLTEPNTASEEIPIGAEVSVPTVSTAEITDGFSFGFGESIFAIMIAAPFLLLSLKRGRR